jgi:DNA-binding PadR family transcriptional regulator
MNLQSVHDYYVNPPKTRLSREETVCYVASCLIHKDSYATELLLKIKNSAKYTLSDTVLFSALQVLIQSELVTSYQKRTEGKGRPRRMFSVNASMRAEVKKLAEYWTRENNS